MSTEKISQNVRARFNHHQSRVYLAEKYQNQLTLVSQGGIWTVTPELLVFLQSSSTTVILLDDNDRPTKVNAKELYVAAQELYDTIMSDWHKEFTELEKNR